jgi:hypothetical protein
VFQFQQQHVYICTDLHLHAHEDVGRMPALEAVVGEVPARLFHLGMLLRRAEVRVELPHGPPDEAVRRAQQGAAAALRRHLQLPHATVLCVCEGAGRGHAMQPNQEGNC